MDEWKLGQQGRGGMKVCWMLLFLSVLALPVELGLPSSFSLSLCPGLGSTLGSKHVFVSKHSMRRNSGQPWGGHIIYGALRRGAALGQGSLGVGHTNQFGTCSLSE